MNEIILGLVILALLTERYFYGKLVAKQHKDLLRLIKAKSLEEVTQAELVDKVKPEKPVQTDPDLVPTELADDKLFDRMIQKQMEEHGSN